MKTLTRRVLITTCAVVLGGYYLLTELPVDRAEFFGFVMISGLLVAGLMLLAFVLASLLRLIRRRRDSG